MFSNSVEALKLTLRAHSLQLLPSYICSKLFATQETIIQPQSVATEQSRLAFAGWPARTWPPSLLEVNINQISVSNRLQRFLTFASG